MARTIFVSRHRMTECPSCHAHVRVDEDVKGTACAFCGAKMTAPKRDVFALLRDVGTSTGGMVAAALLGLNLVSCAEAPTTETRQADAAEQIAVPLYGIAPQPDAHVRQMDAAEPIPAPEYGAPAPEDAAVHADAAPVSRPDAVVADAEEPVPEPDYGIPPLDDASVEDSGDPPPVALYGISPLPVDAGVKVEDAGEEPVMPLYGGAAVQTPTGEILS